MSHIKKEKRKENIEVSLFDYMKGVSNTIHEEFIDDAEQEVFVTNVFNEIESKEIKLCCHQTLSKILQSLLNIANSDNVNKFLLGLLKDLKFVATHWLASHVLQTCFDRLRVLHRQEEQREIDDDILCTITKLCDIFKSYLQEFITHQYASHVLRSFLEMLSGVYISPLIIRAKIGKEKFKNDSPVSTTKQQCAFIDNKSVKNAFYEILDKIFHKISLGSFMKGHMSSLVIQSCFLIMKELHEHDPSSICKATLDCLLSKDIKSYFCSESASRIIEVLMPLLIDDMWDQFLEKVIMNIQDYCLDGSANFIIQKVIASVKTKEQFNHIYGELEDIFEDILAAGHPGLLVALAKGCVAHQSKQKEFYTQLLEAFHCNDEEKEVKFAFPLLSMCTYDMCFVPHDGKEAIPTFTDINLHGALIAQSLLLFKNQRFSNSLLNFSPVHLKFASCHPSGSHVVDAFYASRKVNEKHKEELMLKLVGLYSDVACNKHGSRILEGIWRESIVSRRETVADDLMTQEGKVKHDRFGKYIYLKYHLEHYKHNKKEWRANQVNRDKSGKNRIDKTVESLTEDMVLPAKKKKKKNTNAT